MGANQSFLYPHWAAGYIRPKFEELIHCRWWVKGSKFTFHYFPGRFFSPYTFIITPDPTVNQPGNGPVYFSFLPNHSSWKSLQPFLQPGFAKVYYELRNGTFWHFPSKEHIACFILLQFEIARRVQGEPAYIPSKDVIADGIRIALYFDTPDAYNTMINMFCGESGRIEAYKTLRSNWELSQPRVG